MSFDIESFITDAVQAHAETALWASLDDQGEPLDDNYDTSDFSHEAWDSMAEDVEDFVRAQWELVQDFSGGGVGHDFFLTRNRHGVGFWDGRYPEDIGAALTKASHPYGEVYFWVSDNGRIQLD